MTIDRPIIIAIVAGALLSALAELLFVSKREAYFVGSDLFLFWVVFGLLSCIAIVEVSKWVGHTFLMRHDDPYTGEHVEAEPPLILPPEGGEGALPEAGEAEGPVPPASGEEDGDA